MGEKRLKLVRGLGDFVPISMNFSELEEKYSHPGEMGGEPESHYNPSDDGLEQKRLEDSIEYEEMIVQILCNLELREKLVFIFQLLRDGGYQIDHGAFAKTIHLSRRQYMRILDDVRMKSVLFIKGHREMPGHKGIG